MQDPSYNPSKSSSFSFGADKLGLGVLVYAYAMLLGAAYIFGYWRVFGFDIFPYLSTIDYISAPLSRLLVLVAAPVLASLVFFSQSDRTESRFLSKISTYLVALYVIAFANNYYRAVARFVQADFYYENEKTVLVFAALLFLAGCGFTYRMLKRETNVVTCAAALILMQLAGTISAGYSDGKAIFNGAENVFFLEDKHLCDPGAVRDWVYLGKFSSETFFMNTIDKRLCLTDASSFRLTSRRFSEGL